jgi:hypothetical protein
VTIAGHLFVDGVCSCGRKRSQIRGVTRHCIGAEGWAHTGKLLEYEFREILQDQPPPPLTGVLTTVWSKTEGIQRFYHDCQAEIQPAASDTVNIEEQTWYCVECPICHAFGRVRYTYPRRLTPPDSISHK